MNTPQEVVAEARRALVGCEEFVVLAKTEEGIVSYSSIYSRSTLEFVRVLTGTAADVITQATGAPEAETLFKSALLRPPPKANGG